MDLPVLMLPDCSGYSEALFGRFRGCLVDYQML